MKFSLFIAAFALLSAFPAQAQSVNHQVIPMKQATEQQLAPSVKAIAFHSDFCGSCKILGPRMKEAVGLINVDKIDIIKFDFTNKDKITQTKQLALDKNIDPILQKYGAKTGFIVLVDAKNNVIDTINVDHDTAAIASKFVTAIANAS